MGWGSVSCVRIQWHWRPENEGWWWFKPVIWIVLIAVSKLWFTNCIFKCLTSQTWSDLFIRWMPAYNVSKKTHSKSIWCLIYSCSRKQSTIPFWFQRQHGSGLCVVQPAHKAALSTPKKPCYSVAKLVTEHHTEEPNIGSIVWHIKRLQAAEIWLSHVVVMCRLPDLIFRATNNKDNISTLCFPNPSWWQVNLVWV